MSQEPKIPIQEVVAHVGRYPMEAFEFVEMGLSYTVERVHGSYSSDEAADSHDADPAGLSKDRHVSGRQLCDGLKDLARRRWGRMARAVLQHWNITRTEDFGQIVFALVNSNHMQKKPQDTIDDFKDVYDFTEAFETSYRVTAN